MTDKRRGLWTFHFTHADDDHIEQANLHRMVQAKEIVHIVETKRLRNHDKPGEPGRIWSIYVDDVAFYSTRKAMDNPKPPELGISIIEYLCPPDRIEAVLGDLEETFKRRAKRKSLAAARRWYWWQVCRTVIAFALEIRSLLRRFGF